MNPDRDRSAENNQEEMGAAAPAPAGMAPRQMWLSEELLGNRQEILIQHGSEIYRLRRTKQGKLILHK